MASNVVVHKCGSISHIGLDVPCALTIEPNALLGEDSKIWPCAGQARIHSSLTNAWSFIRSTVGIPSLSDNIAHVTTILYMFAWTTEFLLQYD